MYQKMSVNTATIRHFITQYFDDNELSYFCADYFREVYEDFSSGMSKRQKAHSLVEYCYRHGRLPDLLTELERKRPVHFHKYFLTWTAGDDLVEDVKYVDYYFEPFFETEVERIQHGMVVIIVAVVIIVVLFVLVVLPGLPAQ